MSRGRRSWIIGRLVVSTTHQASGAPIVDRAFTRDEQGRTYAGVAIHLSPWRRNCYGDRDLGLALVLGWRR